MDYENFDLAIELIDQTDRRYRTRVLSSPVGQATAGFELPFTQKELSSFFWVSGRILRQLRSTPTSADNVSLNPREFGAKLYDTVFVGDVRVALARSMDEVERQQKGLRIRLRLSEAPDLADLPWEFLYATDKHRPLSLSLATPLVRYLDLSVAERSLKVQPPLRILCIVSSPSDATEIDVEKEWRNLQNSLGDLQRRKLIALERLPQATFPALRDYLNQHEIHILHFIGHGAFDADHNEGGLFFEDNDGKGHLVSAERLSIPLNNYKSLRLIFLNACESARSGKADNFGGVAQNLVQQGVPAVVAMQFSVSNDAAITLAHQFYQGVANGYPVDTALADARIALHADGDDLEWGTPVLYLRSGDGNLFDLAKPEKERWRQVGALFSILAGLVLLGMLFLQGAQWLSSWSILRGRATETATASPGNTMDAPATTVVSAVAAENLSPSYTPPSTTEAVSVATHLSDFMSEVSTIHAFTTTTPQVGDGTRITVADLSANAPVTVSLHTDEEGKPSAFSLFSMLVMSGTYEDLALAIPEENRPTANARFWIQLFEPDTPTATQRISVELQLETEPKIIPSDIITVTTLQIGNGSRIMIDWLSATNAVTVTLYDDDSGVPSQLPITTTVLEEGSYENVSLMIPEDSQPVQSSVFWIQVYNTGTITAAVSISVMLDLNMGIIGNFVIEPQQRGDGSMITLTKLVVYQDTILVGVLGSDPTGQQIKPDDVRVLQLIQGPARYENIPIFLPQEKRPTENSRLWVRLYKEADNPSGSPQPVDFILYDGVTNFLVQQAQSGQGDVITVDKISTNAPVTVTLYTDDSGIPSKYPITSTVLSPGNYENTSVAIPWNNQPVEDSIFWIQIYDRNTITAVESISVALSLNISTIGDFVIEPQQVSDGSMITLTKLVVYQDSILVGVLGSDPTGQQIKPDDIRVLQPILGPARYKNIPIYIPKEKRPTEDSRLWIRLYKERDNPATSPQSVDVTLTQP